MATRKLATTKRITQNQQEWLKQKRRINRAVRELEKQGYRFTQETKDFISTQLQQPSRITQQRLKKLKNISRTTLRSQSTAISQKTGKVVSGTQAFKESMSIRSQKSAKTRLANKATMDTSKSTQAQKDVSDKGIATKPDIDLSIIPSVNEFIFDKLIDRINDYDTAGSVYLRRLLNQEIKRFGFDSVMQTVNNMPADILNEIDYVIFYEENTSSAGASRSLRKFSEAITGSILSGKSLQDFSLFAEEHYNNMET